MRQKPVIGINADFRPTRKEGPSLCYLPAGYFTCIERAGAIPLVIPPLESEDDLARILDTVQGFVMVGGGDLDVRRDALLQLVDLRAMPPTDRLRLATRLAGGFSRDRQALYGTLDTWASLWRDAVLTVAGAPEGVTDPALAEDIGKLVDGLSVAATARALAEVQAAQDALRRNAIPRIVMEVLLLALP